MAPKGNARLPRQDSTTTTTTDQSTAPLSRSASATSTTAPLRPKSRGSTTSLQSVGVGDAFQPTQSNQDQNMPIDQSAFFLQNGSSQGHHPLYPQHADEAALLQYQQHMQHAHMMDHAAGLPPHPDMRPMSQHGFHEMPYPLQYPNGMPQYQLPPQHMHHMRHQSEQYEGSPAPEDSNTENGGSKRRKGTASSMANDQELRRLLTQYGGKTLKDVATEVQKNEGSGGKSEKAKQVFAMLWLQESCQRSNNSVRRDRVFARYTERCGNERVPTLNPASFGKLVRIIFPNVQTRRLGVRGESKYHYVDLSLVPDDNDRQYDTFERPSTAGGIRHERPESAASFSGPLHLHSKAASVSHLPIRASMETADFPAPSASFLSRIEEAQAKRPSIRKVKKLDCQFANTPTIRIPAYNMSVGLATALPSVRSNLPATLSTYLAMPSTSSLSQPVPTSQESPIELPDIHEYLKDTTYDPQLAKLLHDLYRSYCIDVIDAFRKCKDKSFFNHHSAFNGKMTVPVSKIFSLECVAPWIQECDMRMYKQILRYMTPLVLQNVPDPVWVSFDRISSRLVGHLIASFEEKCPSHVLVAKVIPAARFANLLKKLRLAQTATLQVSRILENPQQRTQMWLDVCAMLDPEIVIDDSVPPPESIQQVRGALKHDLRILLAPVADALVEAAEQDPSSAFADFYRDLSTSTGMLSNTHDLSNDQLGKMIQWLELLPTAFDGHHPQCMLDWQTRFFKSIMNQLGSGGAPSYQAWWYLENFATQMLTFMTQLEGLLLPAEEQQELNNREIAKKTQYTEIAEEHDENNDASSMTMKRKRNEADIGDEDRMASPRPRTSAGDTEPGSAVSATFPPLTGGSAIQDDTDDMAEINRGGPLDLPSFRTGFTSPIKPRDDVQAPNPGLHDDSGIDLGLNTDLDPDAMEAEKEAKKFNKRDWFLSSDPVEPHSVAQGVS